MRYFLLVLSILFAATNLASSQTQMPDSVQERLNTLSAKEEIDYLHTLIINSWLNYPNEAMMYANEAVRLSDSIGDRYLSSKSLRLKGGVHYYLGSYDSTLFYSKQALEIATAIKDTILINNSLNNLGLVYYNLGSYQNALENLLQALQLKEISGEVYGRAQTINNVGLVYNELKDYKRARSYFMEALDFATVHNDPNLQLYSLNNIGETYLSQEDLEKADEYFERSRKLNIDNKNWNAVTLSGLAQVSLKRGDYIRANTFFQEALKLREEINDKKGESEIYFFYAKDALTRNKYDSAIYYLDKSQKIARMIGSKDRMFDNLELYVGVYSQLGDLGKAFNFQTELIKLRDTLFNENMARNLADIQLKIQKGESSALLNQKEKQLSDSKRIAAFLIIITALVIVMLVVILLALDNNRRKNKILGLQNEEIKRQKEEIVSQKESLVKQNIELEDAHSLIKEQNEQLEKYNEQLLLTVEERTKELEESNERLKIANLELDNFIYKSSHDIKGPLATLMGVCNVALVDIKEPRARQYFTMLADTSNGLNEILARLKTVSDINSLELNVIQIDFNDILNRCIEQVKKVEEVKKLNVKYKIQDNIVYKADPFLIDLIVFNMIHNATKFQKNNTKEFIKIKVSQKDNDVVMDFIDNGIGIDEEDTENIFHIYSKSAIKHQSLGLGLYLVKQCIEKLGGDIMVINDDELTHFRIKLPIH